MLFTSHINLHSVQSKLLSLCAIWQNLSQLHRRNYIHFWRGHYGSVVGLYLWMHVRLTTVRLFRDKQQIRIGRPLLNPAASRHIYWQRLKSSPPITWHTGQTVKCAVHSAGYQTSIRMNERNKFVTTSVLLARGRSSRPRNRRSRRAGGAQQAPGVAGRWQEQLRGKRGSSGPRFHRSARRASGCQLALGQ